MKKLTLTALCLALLLALQSLLVPKYVLENPEGALTREYYRFAGDNDVLFLGDCEVYENFSPIALWEHWGIPSAIRGSPQQTIWQSYYLLEDALRREKPRVVIYNVLAMKYDTVESTGPQNRREAYNRMTLEGMAWSGSKLRAILASQTEQERQWESLVSYLFPLLRYHDRWHQLTREDLRWWLEEKPLVSHNGYLMHTGVYPAGDPPAEQPRTSFAFGENSWHYLDKMTQLCREQGVQLVLIKAPSLYPIWHPEWEAQIQAYAREQGLLYINMIPHEEQIGLDWNRDTFDGGLHLNVYGAEKAAIWLGGVLQEECGLADRREEAELAALWEEKCLHYYNERQKGALK